MGSKNALELFKKSLLLWCNQFYMEIALSWDLFIISIFTLIVAYSFIIGIDRTIKTVIATYLGLLTADGLVNIIDTHILINQKVIQGFQFLGYQDPQGNLLMFKVIIFLAVVVILTIKGNFSVSLKSDRFKLYNPVFTGLFGVLNSGLIVSTLLLYLSGNSIIEPHYANTEVLGLYSNSHYVRILVDYYSFWFSLPVLLILFLSIWPEKKAT